MYTHVKFILVLIKYNIFKYKKNHKFTTKYIFTKRKMMGVFILIDSSIDLNKTNNIYDVENHYILPHVIMPSELLNEAQIHLYGRLVYTIYP